MASGAARREGAAESKPTNEQTPLEEPDGIEFDPEASVQKCAFVFLVREETDLMRFCKVLDPVRRPQEVVDVQHRQPLPSAVDVHPANFPVWRVDGIHRQPT